MAYETLKVKITDHICMIQLDRPKAMNALNAQMILDLCVALQSADENAKVRCIVITGTEKAFAAGADIDELAHKTYVDMMDDHTYGRKFASISDTRKPIIAAVAGYALGAGCELAMMCDIIICADTAKFGQPEVNLGVIAGLGGTQRLTRCIGKSKAMEMHLTGRFMYAEEAEKAGLACAVVPAAKLLERAMDMAEKIAEKSQISVCAAKQAVNAAFDMPLNEGLKFERQIFQSLFATEDQNEGMAAFLEKREAQFRDK